MKILVNGTPLLAPLTGIGQYIRRLFTAMAEIEAADVYVYYGSRCVKGMQMPSEQRAKTVQRVYGLLQRVVPRPRAMRKVVEKALFAYHARQSAGGVIYHEPNYVALPYKGPMVLTVCDLSCFDHPEAHPAERVSLMQRDMPESIARADHIIVISEATGTALRRWFDVDPARITTTYLAADARFRPHSTLELAPVLAAWGLVRGQYLLSVGTLEPRKNLTALFDAYAGLAPALRQRFPLVVAGMSGWHTQGLMKSAEGLINRGELKLLGYVDDALVPALYAGAAAFCYPSRYEGFGLPALEAMACGVPVITSNRTSLPEVVGDAGLMVDPDDVDALREQLRSLLEDQTLAQNLGQRGLQRAHMFSWDRCARETYAVYEQVLQQRGCKF